MRADVDVVAARRMAPAARPAAEVACALKHERAKAAFRKGYRASEPSDPTAHNNHSMRYMIDVHLGYIKAEMRGRETGGAFRTPYQRCSARDWHVALIADSKEVAMSQEYIALLGRQKGFHFRSFAAEAQAVEWLRAAA